LFQKKSDLIMSYRLAAT